MSFSRIRLSIRFSTELSVLTSAVALMFVAASPAAVRCRPALAQRPTVSTMSLQARLRQQNLIFMQEYREELRTSPETETALGDYSQNAKLDDYSLAASARQNATDRWYLAKIRSVSPEGFPENDRISNELFVKMLEQRLTDYELKNYEMPVTQMDGIQIRLADLPNLVPLDTVQHYLDYIARLRQIPRVLQQTIQVLRQGEKDGLMPPRVLLEQVAAECQQVIRANPFLEPTKKYPAAIENADQERLTRAVTKAVNEDVLPAYRSFGKFINESYAPHARLSIGLSALPNGSRRYQQAIEEQTSTEMTPGQIHELGLSEVARIKNLLTQIARQQGFADLQSYRAALNSDPKYIPVSASQIVDDFRQYATRMQQKLPELFDSYPVTPVEVQSVSAAETDGGTHFIPGTPDGSRPARIVVATSDFARRRLFTDETIAYHEGIPGHLLQVSIQQHLRDLPEFRQQMFNAAYAEGWAAYAEALGKEIGFFQDPGSDYGRLNTELLRAVRLVVDTGIHAQGWTREQALAYLRDSGAVDTPMVASEVDRYIAWPAQGLSYKLGQLKILELRRRAQQQLGFRFDIRKFHEEILGAGNLPLDVLEERVNLWIARQ